MEKKSYKSVGRILAMMLAVMFLITITVTEAAAAGVPSKVTLLSVTAQADQTVVVKWKKAAGAEGYQIYYRENSKGNYTKLTDINQAGSLSFTTHKLNVGRKYSFKVRAFAKSNAKRIYGAFSAQKTVTAKGSKSKSTSGWEGIYSGKNHTICVLQDGENFTFNVYDKYNKLLLMQGRGNADYYKKTGNKITYKLNFSNTSGYRVNVFQLDGNTLTYKETTYDGDGKNPQVFWNGTAKRIKGDPRKYDSTPKAVENEWNGTYTGSYKSPKYPAKYAIKLVCTTDTSGLKMVLMVTETSTDPGAKLKHTVTTIGNVLLEDVKDTMDVYFVREEVMAAVANKLTFSLSEDGKTVVYTNDEYSVNLKRTK